MDRRRAGRLPRPGPGGRRRPPPPPAPAPPRRRPAPRTAPRAAARRAGRAPPAPPPPHPRPGQQQTQYGVTKAPFGLQVGPALLQSQGEQRPGGVDHGVGHRREGPRRPDGEEPARPRTTAQRLHHDVLVRPGQRQAGREPPPTPPDPRRRPPRRPARGEEPGDLGGDRVGVGAGGGVAYLAGLVQQDRPAAGLLGQPVDDRVGALGAQGGAGQPALGGEGAGDLVVLLGGEQFADQLADRDERRLARHLQQRQPRLLGGGHERGRDLLVGEPDTEAQPGHPTSHQPGDISRKIISQPDTGGQQQLVPFRKGAGSSSSLTATHRTTVSSPPATGRSPIRRTTARKEGAIDFCPFRQRKPPIVLHIDISELRGGHRTVEHMSIPQERRLVTPIPGPKSQELLARKQAAVPPGIGVTLPVFVTRAGGGVVQDVDGNSLIDFGSGIAVTSVGNAAPKVVERVQRQVAEFTHTCFMITPYESYVAGVREAQRAHPRRPREADGAPQQRRRGRGERGQDRQARHRPARGRRVRPRLPRPHPAHDDAHGQEHAVQAGLRPVRARGLPGAAGLPVTAGRPARRTAPRRPRRRPST